MNTANEVLSALSNPAIPFTKEDVNRAWTLLRARDAQLQALAAVQFRPGENVRFEARGITHEGVVKKVNQKTVQVQVGLVRWNVAASFLRLATSQASN